MNNKQIEIVLNELADIGTGREILKSRERALKLDLEKLKAQTIENPDILLEIQKEDINDLDNKISPDELDDRMIRGNKTFI